MAGYSGTPLVKKLGIKPGQRLAFLEEPATFRAALGPLPGDGPVVTKLPARGTLDLIVLFATKRGELERGVARSRARLEPTGGLWIAWPKKARATAIARLETDLTGDAVREVGLASGLVDNKVCAIDDVWSGLQFVVRTADRPEPSGGEVGSLRAKPGHSLHPAREPRKEPTPRLPADVNAALGAAGVRPAWDALAPSHRRDWLRAIEDARRPETRTSRIAALVAKLGV